MPKISKLSLNQTMAWVIGASVPALCVLGYWQGIGFWVNLGVAIGAGLAFDLGRNPAVTIITAILFAAGIPSLAPFWVPIVGMFFAIVIAKHLYGGLGHNIFNPAMVGYAVCLVAFPKEMVVWPAWALDGISAATPLDHASSIVSHDLLPYFILNAAWLLGGLILLFKKIIRWQIPIGVMLGVLFTACFFPYPIQHLGLGSTMIAACFIATDPVTAPGEPSMRLIYGLLIGSLIILLRHYSSYPDGVAFAILLGNLCVPLMDSFSTRKFR